MTAWVDGQQVETAVVSGGLYDLTVTQPGGSSFAGETVRFKIDNVSANQSAIWALGGNQEVNLTSHGQGGFIGMN